MPEIFINGQAVQAGDDQTVMQVARANGIFIPYFCWHPNLSVPGNCRICVVEVEGEGGGNGWLDIACNTAALSRRSGPIHEYERSVFDQTLEMCLTNTWLCMKYEIAAMLATGGGAIVNISSNSSLKGQAFNTAYAAAKGGVNILTKSSAAEYGAQGIRINAVSPGVIRTPGVEKYFAEQPKMAEGLKKPAVMNRLGEPEEIAEAVTFLSSDRASFITGQILSVDGGGAVR